MSKHYGTLKDEEENEFYPTPRRDTGIKQGKANLFSNVFSCWVQEKTGAICIRVGTSKRALHNVMLHIHGYFYHYTGLTDFDAGVYYYSSTSSFYSPMYRIQNKHMLNKIRFGTDSEGYVYLILGDTSSTWAYTGVFIDSVMLGFANTGSYRFIDGWEYKIVTDFTGWTIVNCSEIDKVTQGQSWDWTYIVNNLNVAGLASLTSNGNTLTIGSQNAQFCHIYNSANIPFYYNRGIYVNGHKLNGYDILYNNSSGSNGTITLNSSKDNYDYIEIFYRDDWSICQSVAIPSDKVNVGLWISRYTTASQTVISRYRVVNISGTTLKTNGDQYGTHNSWNNSVASDNYIYVYKVLGYKFG